MRRSHTSLIMPALMSGLLAGASAMAGARSDGDPLKVAESLRGSLVRVEYTLRYDKGQAPEGAGLMERCPSCGAFHVEDGTDAVTEERPVEAAGYLIASDRVLTSELFMHPRFIEKTEVVLGDDKVAAAPIAYGRDQHGMILQLDRPLRQGKALVFDPARPGPYSIANYAMLNGEWTTTVQPMSTGSINVTESELRFVPVNETGLIVAEDGTPVAVNMSGELAPGEEWKMSPEKWQWLSAAEHAALLSQAQAAADGGILRARLDLRSPRATEDEYSPWDYDSSDEDEATEIEAMCVLVDGKTALVLSSLKPAVTARLERITIFPAGSEDGVSATFTATLRDYGALVAALDAPLSAPVKFSTRDLLTHRNRLIVGADIALQGKDRIAYFTHRRISRFYTGWRRNVYPSAGGDDENLFLFDETAALIALPIIKREPVGVADRWSDDAPTLTWAGQVAAALADLEGSADPNNVPLSEEEENRVAWLGVIMQGLDSELARQLGVSEVSQDGSVAGLVTFVYPDSPAAAAGIKDGDVLLRVQSDSLPTPLDVEVDEDDEFGSAFPWQQLDAIPEEYFEMIPTPWPKVNNAFNKRLTAVGFGTPIRIEYARDGQMSMAEMTVTQSPLYYAAAPQYESEALGLTVRTMTYEVRRYFQKSEDDPGVIIARLEPGSKASVAGVKPYEIITAVNDQPVHTEEEFRSAIIGQTELRLSMLRMTRSRLVKITLPEPIADEQDEGGELGEGDEAGEVEEAGAVEEEGALTPADSTGGG